MGRLQGCRGEGMEGMALWGREEGASRCRHRLGDREAGRRNWCMKETVGRLKGCQGAEREGTQRGRRGVVVSW